MRMSSDYKKVTLNSLKEKFESWLDWNMSISDEKEFRIKEQGMDLYGKGKKLFLKVTETGGRDYMNDGTEYYMVLQSLKDENEMNEEIEKD